MTLSETVGEGIISVAISGGSFHILPGLLRVSCPGRAVITTRPVPHPIPRGSS